MQQYLYLTYPYAYTRLCFQEKQWEDHMAEVGRGVSMYQTTDGSELVVNGIPELLRGELWAVFSGSILQKVNLFY